MHLIALLAEGTNAILLNGRLYLSGRTSAKAQAILDEHGAAIRRLIAAIGAGKVDRQALAAKFAEVDGWHWPGLPDAPATWPGLAAFLLGVELVPCTSCKRWERGRCARYDRIERPTRPVRCLWALPRAN